MKQEYNICVLCVLYCSVGYNEHYEFIITQVVEPVVYDIKLTDHLAFYRFPWPKLYHNDGTNPESFCKR